MPASMPSMSGAAQLNTAWKMRNITTASTTMPATGCSSTASMRAAQRLSRGRCIADRAEHAMQLDLGLLGLFAVGFFPGRQRRRPAPPASAPARCASMSASAPPRFTATVGSTGMPSSSRQPRDVDLHAAAPRHVHAIQRHHHRQAHALHFERQPQADRQVDRIDHAHHESRRRRIGHAAQQHVARDGLVERGRLETVGAGQIEHAQRRGRRRPVRSPSRRSTVTPG